MKRMKVPDYKDKNVFGVPLIVHVQRSGQPLPLGLQQALRYLRSQCLDQVNLHNDKTTSLHGLLLLFKVVILNMLTLLLGGALP